MKKNINKGEIIYNVLLYIRTQEERYKAEALQLIEALAKNYHIVIKKTRNNISLQDAIEKFALNGQGYIITINNLYNAIK